jgi:cytochrome c551/c552
LDKEEKMTRSTRPYRRWLKLFLFTAALLALTACATSSSETGAASSSDGETLFRQSVLGGLAGCATCHSVEPGVVIIGPTLAGIGSAAAERQPSQTAEIYLRESIIDPDAYLVEGYPKGVMPSRYGEQLSEEQVESLVLFMLTLR